MELEINIALIAILTAVVGLVVVLSVVFLNSRASDRNKGTDGASGGYDVSGNGKSCTSDGGGCDGGGGGD